MTLPEIATSAHEQDVFILQQEQSLQSLITFISHDLLIESQAGSMEFRVAEIIAQPEIGNRQPGRQFLCFIYVESISPFQNSMEKLLFGNWRSITIAKSAGKLTVIGTGWFQTDVHNAINMVFVQKIAKLFWRQNVPPTVAYSEEFHKRPLMIPVFPG